MHVRKAIPFFACLLAVLPFASCENDIRRINAITHVNKELPAERGRDVKILYSDSGIKTCEITASVMQHYMTAKPYVEMPEGVIATFYNADGGTRSRLTADYAVKREQEKLFEARGNVVLINEKGDRLNSEKLIWDDARQKIHSDQFVKITTSDEIIYGQGFESNPSFTRYRIFRIKGTITLKK